MLLCMIYNFARVTVFRIFIFAFVVILLKILDRSYITNRFIITFLCIQGVAVNGDFIAVVFYFEERAKLPNTANRLRVCRMRLYRC